MQQSLSKGTPSMAQEVCTCDDHEGIPRDAKGVPIYLILPDDIRVKFECKIAACENWTQTHDPLAYIEAAVWVWSHRQPLPTWLLNAIARGGIELRSPQQAENARLRYMHHARYRAVMDAMYDYIRTEDGPFKLVARRNSKGRPISKQKAYETAARICKCDWPAAKRSFKVVRDDLANGYAGRYHTLKTPRLDALPAR